MNRRPIQTRNRPKVETLEPRQMLAASDILISEFMAANSDSLRDEDGDTSDWIELYNNSDESVSLNGLILADDTDQWSLPAKTLEPFEFLLVFASGKNRRPRTGELHTNFKLAAEGEPLRLLAQDGSVIHEYESYPFQVEDKSYGIEMSTGRERTLLRSNSEATYIVPTNNSLEQSWTEIGFDDSSWEEGRTGIGYERSGSNYAPLLNSRVPSGTRGFYARIEFDADVSNLNALTLKMRYDDGFIAYLNGTRVADGNGVTNPRFDSLASGENADGDAERFEDFDISLFSNLLLPTGNVLAVHSLNRATNSSDMLMMPEIRYSLPGEVNADNVGFFNAPSPNGLNDDPIPGFTAPVTIDLPHGFYETSQRVTISSPDSDSVIRYTVNGAPPTSTTGVVYSGPITVDGTTVLRAAAFKDDFVPSSVATATYLFANDVASQTRSETLDAGFPSSWNGTSPDYGVDPDVVGPNDDFDGRYADAFESSLKAIPTLSIAIANDAIFGDDGIYANPQNSDLEEAASLEWINPDGTEGFQINAGLKIQGGAFRSFGLTKKKSFRFKFQKQYGAAKLDYPVFGDSAVTSFDTLTLRMEANDGWQWGSNDPENRLYARDEWGRRTQLAMGQPASHGTHTHVYINGFYWGTYNLVERPDEAFASDYMGGDKEDWDVQNSGRAINGDLDSWQEMLSLARAVGDASDGSSSQLAAWQKLQGLNPDGSNNPNFEDYLDVENYIDYLIVNMYGGNSDWPHKNYYAGRQRGPDSTGFKFFMWDSEWSLNLRSSVSTNRTDISGNIAEPYDILKDVPEFQQWFADRVHQHFSPGGALYVDPENSDWDPDHPERNVPAARFVEITDAIREPLIAESARWGDQHTSQPQTVDESWEPEVADLLRNYFPRRSSIVVDQFSRAGLTSDVAAPTSAVVGDQIRLSTSSGAIYYTLDGSDPREVGGSVSANAVRYTAPIERPSGDIQIRFRTLVGDEWSAVNATTVLADEALPADARLAVTEIHYNPADAVRGELDVDNDNFEFIELTNTATTTLDLTGVRLIQTDVDGDTQGIRFNFASQTLAPNESLVVVENLPAFRSRYGDSIRVALGVDLPNDPEGQYGGKLSNSGEQITLLAANGEIIRQFSYSDEWHPETDGDGNSLELIDLGNVNSIENASAWSASPNPHGTPGRIVATETIHGDFNGDQEVNRLDVDALYAAIAAGSTDSMFDLTSDNRIDSENTQFLIEELIDALPGDANLDGTVNFADFLIMSANFGQQRPLTWIDGDFDGDGEVAFADFLLLSTNFGVG